MSKQIHLALGIAPTELKHKETIELFEMLPYSFTHFTPGIALVGIVSLFVLFLWPLVKNPKLKAVPAPLLVLIAGIGLELLLGLDSPNLADKAPLLNPGQLTLAWQVDFSAMWNNSRLFWQYVFLFAFIGSLESTLTAKAIDLLDPWKRKARLNRDLMAVGIGNTLVGILGGLPMISEVARSSANVQNGGRTVWANFFQGLALLLFMLFLNPLIKLVPMASLAAMLIYVGIKLASPRAFAHAYRVGPEQFAVFLTTVVVTLFSDLLIGILLGVLVSLFIDLFMGQKLHNLFVAKIKIIAQSPNHYTVSINGACTFSNWFSFERQLNRSFPQKAVKIDLDVQNVGLIDHSFIENILHLQDEWKADGAVFEWIGLDNLEMLSKDPHCTRIKRKEKNLI